MKLKNYRELLEEELKDPEFKKLWDESEEEFQKELQRLRAEIEQEKRAAETQKNIA